MLVPDLVAEAAWVAVALVTLRSRDAVPVLALLIAVSWIAVDFAPATVFWHRALLAHLILAGPRWWPRSRTAQAVLVVQYVAAVLVVPWAHALGALALGALLLLGLSAEGQRTECGPLRWAAATLASVGFALPALLPWPPSWGSVVSWAYAALVTSIALLIMADARLSATDADPLDRLVELGVAADVTASPSEHALVSELRASHDALTARIEEGLAELRASRRRLTEAALSAAAELSDDLHDQVRAPLGVLARLPTPAGAAGSAFDEARRHLVGADADIEGILLGIGPRSFVGGLAPSLGLLATACAVPTAVTVRDGDLPEAVARTAYLVCSEALANVAKHAAASSAQVQAVVGPSSLVLTVQDDGSGGVDPRQGTGIVGMRDRVDALGGALHVESTPSGTTVQVILPWGDDAAEADSGAARRIDPVVRA